MRKFLDNKTYNWPLVKTIVSPRHQPRCVSVLWFWTVPRNPKFKGIKVQVKRTFKRYSFLSDTHTHTQNRQALLKISLSLSASLQPLPQPSISKSMSPYSVVPSFSTPRSGSTKWQTKIVTYYLSALGLP